MTLLHVGSEVLQALYKYPQAEYPYAKLVEESRKRGREDREYEIEDSGVFADGKYWDVQIEYAKAGPNDILIEYVFFSFSWMCLTCQGQYRQPWSRRSCFARDSSSLVAKYLVLGRRSV